MITRSNMPIPTPWWTTSLAIAGCLVAVSTLGCRITSTNKPLGSLQAVLSTGEAEASPSSRRFRKVAHQRTPESNSVDETLQLDLPPSGQEQPSEEEPLETPPGALSEATSATAGTDADPDVGDGLPAEPDALPNVAPAAQISPLSNEVYPVDLPTALRLAGGNSLQVAVAAEQLSAAMTRVDQADARWLPSVRVGFSFNRHNGRIQATEGNIVEASRGSFFAGGGLGTGSAPLNGGAGGPPRLMVDLSLSEILFEPLAARRMVEVAAAEHTTTFNETLLEAASAYLRLVSAQAALNTIDEIRSDVQRLVDLAEAYAEAGEGKTADVQRAKAELARWRHAEFGREEEVRVAALDLARILRLAPGTILTATDEQLHSWEFFRDSDETELVATAIAARPEMSRAFATTRATSTEVAREHWRPYLPNLMLGFSGGTFGGDTGSQWKNVSDRTDVDLAAVWELENLGWGNSTRRDLAANRHRQARLQVDIARDAITAQVLAANQRCRIRQGAITAASDRLVAATKSMDAALLGIREGVQLPLEAQQSVAAVADARLAYLNAIAHYNLAQLQLLYAVGSPVSENQVIPIAN
jgi:outer membrane protein TolC